MDNPIKSAVNKVTRIEYIDKTGRVLVRRFSGTGMLEFSLQDEGRTLKIFEYSKGKEDESVLK